MSASDAALRRSPPTSDLPLPPPSSPPARRPRRGRAAWFLYPPLLLLAAVFLFPFYWMVKSSLVDLGSIFEPTPSLVPHNPTLSNFVTALTMFPFGRFFLNSLFVAVLTVAGTLLTASMCAFSFSRLRWRWRSRVFSVVLTGMMLPFFVVMIPQFIMWRYLGLTNGFTPLIAPAWFGGGVFNIFLLRQFFLGIPRDLDEAAVMDGASKARIFFQIILPLSKPALIVVGLLTFLASWNDYLAPLIFITTEEKYTLMLGLNMFLGGYTAQWNYLMAATCAIVLPSVLIFLVAQKYLMEGIVMTGLKG
ncbi:MAG TPA: carbohydrate ABC transporter permease [Anaeromyxobacter sp.]|nr:carbohydrate ABC transporter permease [Anaeromyxobacter sp.]